MSLESLLEAEASSIFSLVVDFLCFLVWNMGIMLLHPVKSTQLAYFDAVMAFRINIFRIAYLNCKTLARDVITASS